MTIPTNETESELAITLQGRLDTNTAPQPEVELRSQLDAQKRMNKQGKLVIRHVNETVMEVFEVTGFCDILTIEA